MKIFILLTLVLLSTQSFASTDVEKNLCIKQLIIADDYGLGGKENRPYPEQITPIYFKNGKVKFYYSYKLQVALLTKKGPAIWSPAEFLKNEDGRLPEKSLPGGQISSDDLKELKNWYLMVNKYTVKMQEKDFIKKLNKREAANYEKIFSACGNIDDMEFAPHKGSIAAKIKQVAPLVSKKFAAHTPAASGGKSKSSH